MVRSSCSCNEQQELEIIQAGLYGGDVAGGLLHLDVGGWSEKKMSGEQRKAEPFIRPGGKGSCEKIRQQASHEKVCNRHLWPKISDHPVQMYRCYWKKKLPPDGKSGIRGLTVQLSSPRKLMSGCSYNIMSVVHNRLGNFGQSSPFLSRSSPNNHLTSASVTIPKNSLPIQGWPIDKNSIKVKARPYSGLSGGH